MIQEIVVKKSIQYGDGQTKDLVDLYINEEWLVGTAFDVNKEAISGIISAIKIAYEAGKAGWALKVEEVEL